MGLIGTFEKIDIKTSETETELITITYPNEIPEGDDLYEKRGLTEEISVYKNIEEVTVHENAYLNIKSVNFFQPYFKDSPKYLCNITYEVFESKEHREKNPLSFLYQDYIMSVEFDSSKDIMEQCYGFVKSIRGIDKMIND